MSDELNTLRDLRQRALDDAETALTEAAVRRERRQEKRDRECALAAAATEAVQARLHAERAQQGASFRGRDWTTERRYRARLTQRERQAQASVRSAARALAAAEADVQTARRGVMEAEQQLRVLDKHLERRAAAQRKADGRRAEAEADDLAQRRVPE